MGHDLRLTLRALWRRPRLVLSVVVPLALGLGASIAIFSVVDQVLLKPLAVDDSGALYVLEQDLPELGGQANFATASFLDLVEGNRSFTALTALHELQLTLTGAGNPKQLEAARVSQDFFEVFRLFPLEGRPFRSADHLVPAEGVIGHAPVVLLSEGLWRAHFGSDPSVVGTTIHLNAVPHEVLGVMPEGFQGINPVEVWLPLTFGPAAANDRGGFYLQVIGRLAPGISLELAEQNLQEISHRIASAGPAFLANMRIPLQSLKERSVGDLRPTLWSLFAISTLVLMMICANTAHLLLAHAIGRQREMAVRLALGSSQGPIIRQLLLESLLMAGAGCVLGLGLALLALEAVRGLAPVGLLDPEATALHTGMLLFAVGLAAATAFLFGLGPAVYLARAPMRACLAENSRGTTQGRRHRLAQSTLVVLQMGLAVVLVSAMALMVRSYQELRGIDLGFEASRLATVHLEVQGERYADQNQLRAFVDQALVSMAAIPGVASVGAGVRMPLLDSAGGIWFKLDPRLDPEGGEASHAATFNPVTSGYLESLGIPLLAGRWFANADHETGGRGLLINETLARQFYAEVDPVGQVLFLTPWPEEPWEVLGVVGDTRQGGLKNDSQPGLFVPFGRVPLRRLRFALRTEVDDPAVVLEGARQAVWQVDPSLGIETADSMDNRVAEHLRPERFSLALVSFFGLLSVLLVATSVYSSMAYFVRQRIPEFGIRQALGGRPGDLVSVVLLNGLRLGAVGLALGLLATLGLGRFAESILYKVSPLDPWALVSTLAVLVAALVLAILLPASWAVRVSPSRALRHD